jgi:hypothetical protein
MEEEELCDHCCRNRILSYLCGDRARQMARRRRKQPTRSSQRSIRSLPLSARQFSVVSEVDSIGRHLSPCSPDAEPSKYRITSSIAWPCTVWTRRSRILIATANEFTWCFLLRRWPESRHHSTKVSRSARSWRSWRKWRSGWNGAGS